jgi:hypothetical protein
VLISIQKCFPAHQAETLCNPLDAVHDTSQDDAEKNCPECRGETPQKPHKSYRRTSVIGKAYIRYLNINVHLLSLSSYFLAIPVPFYRPIGILSSTSSLYQSSNLSAQISCSRLR